MGTMISAAAEPEPRIAMVTDWKTRQPIVERMKKHTAKIHSIVLHHSETPNEPAALSRARLRGMQEYHLSRDWGDIAYHFLIDASGTVYAGRDTAYQGDSGTRYDLDGRLLVCVLGNFADQIPEEPARQSLLRLVQDLCDRHDVDATIVATHREVAATDCPGDALHKWIEQEGRSNLGKRTEKAPPKSGQ